MKFNQMDEFEIDEISSVDRPAQGLARALITKSDNPEAIEVTDADGNKYTVIKVAEQAQAVSPGIHNEPASSGGGPNGETPMTKIDDKTADDAEAVAKRIQELEGDLAKANSLASLTDVQKAHYGTLSPEAQADFLSNSPEQREATVEKAAGDDPVLYTTIDGEDIRKSAGSLALSMAKRLDESETNLKIEKAAREREVFAKRAKAELSNLPGTESAQVALLKAVAGIPDEADRKAVSEILAAANTGVSKAFDEAGTSAGRNGDADDANAKLEKMANDHLSSNGGTYSKSYKAVLSTPEGRELFKQTR